MPMPDGVEANRRLYGEGVERRARHAEVLAVGWWLDNPVHPVVGVDGWMEHHGQSAASIRAVFWGRRIAVGAEKADANVERGGRRPSGQSDPMRRQISEQHDDSIPHVYPELDYATSCPFPQVIPESLFYLSLQSDYAFLIIHSATARMGRHLLSYK